MDKQGFSLVEVIIALVVLGILATGILHFRGDSSATDTREQAYVLAQDIRAVIAHAVSSGDDALIAFGDSGGSAWYATWHRDYQDDSTSPPSTRQFSLTRGVAFDATGVAAGPMDLPVSSGAPSSTVICDAWSRCDVGEQALAIYLGVPGNARAQAAVTLGPSGGVRAWIYDPDASEWR